jgi:cysteine desulfurase/selenocysteine lyase
MAIDVEALRRDFPVLHRDWGDRPPLVYLDSACMSLKPRQVVEAVLEYYELHSACAGRSVHTLATEVSLRVDRSRAALARFLGASRPDELVFLRNTTEAINILSRRLGLGRGDAVIVSDREHNSNLVPWLALRDMMGTQLRVVPSEPDGTFDTDRLQEALSPGDVKVVTMAHTNNLDGFTFPIREIAEIAHDSGALVVVDGAQSAPHMPIDLVELDVDFFALSIHKMLGPTGVGVLYGRWELLNEMAPYNVGGDTVSMVEYKGVQYTGPPSKFEAGLQDYGGIYGAEAAIRYLEAIGMEEVRSHDIALNQRATEAIRDLPGIKVLGPQDPSLRGSTLGFIVEDVDCHELGMVLDELGNVAVRSGMHCNHAWFNEHNLPGAVRVSFYVYNNDQDVDRFVEVLAQALGILGGGL